MSDLLPPFRVKHNWCGKHCCIPDEQCCSASSEQCTRWQASASNWRQLQQPVVFFVLSHPRERARDDSSPNHVAYGWFETVWMIYRRIFLSISSHLPFIFKYRLEQVSAAHTQKMFTKKHTKKKGNHPVTESPKIVSVAEAYRKCICLNWLSVLKFWQPGDRQPARSAIASQYLPRLFFPPCLPLLCEWFSFLFEAVYVRDSKAARIWKL